MKYSLILIFPCFFAATVFGQKIKSPDGRFALDFKLNKDGTPVYQLSFKDNPVIKESRLEIELENQPNLTLERRFYNYRKAPTIWTRFRKAIRSDKKSENIQLFSLFFTNYRLLSLV
ncbi:MAG TPA: glycoside hydrolase family 97 N-terminal domain-containing protein [Pyrinomonadaceae bacterium]